MLKRFETTFVICIISLFAVSITVRADTHKPLQYHGGPILRSVKIYPLYYGIWTNADTTEQQDYLKGLTRFMSGENRPSDQQPVTWQYGVYEASVAPGSTSNPNAEPKELTTKELENIINANQKKGNLPKFGPNVLIMVFPAHGFTVTDNPGGGFHHSESDAAFWGVVPHDARCRHTCRRPGAPGSWFLSTGDGS